MKRIMIVEDETAIREFEAINLKRVGYTVVEAGSGEEALEIYDSDAEGFDIALLDISMPGMDGFTLCKELRKRSETLGIIMLTARTQEMDKISGLMLGADDYITKPFSPTELLARVDSLYRRVEMHTPKAAAPVDDITLGEFVLNLRRRTLPEQERLVIDSMLSEANRDPEQLLEEAAQVLASMTNCAAVSTTPMAQTTTVRSVQVVPVAARTALIVLMTSSGIFKNKVCRCDFTLTPEVMRVVARLMNEKITGKPLSEITLAYLQTLAASIGEFAFLVSPILMALFEAVKDASSADVCLEGQANLLAHAEYDDTSARRILSFLNRRAELANLLNQKRGGVQTFIGGDIDRPELADSSMVIARYGVSGEELGSIAVIGPTRMDYSKVMASLEYFSSEVGRILTELLKNE